MPYMSDSEQMKLKARFLPCISRNVFPGVPAFLYTKVLPAEEPQLCYTASFGH